MIGKIHLLQCCWINESLTEYELNGGETDPVSKQLLSLGRLQSLQNIPAPRKAERRWVSYATAAEPVHAHAVASIASVSAEGLWSPMGVGRSDYISVFTLTEEKPLRC